MNDISVTHLRNGLNKLIELGYGELPVRMVIRNQEGKVFTELLVSYQVFEDEKIGPFVSLVTDPHLSERMKAIAPYVVDRAFE